jgi:NADH-quinone oxidoreductase subunit H
MLDPINAIANWLQNLLSSWGLESGLVNFIMILIGVLVVAMTVLVLDILLVWVERKMVARFQDRLGPNRLGPFGLIQPIADVIKLLIKEDITPEGADKVLFNIAPVMALATVLIIWAVIPFAPTMLGASLNVGVLYIVAAGALGTLGILMAGWAAHNKYALVGAFRMVALVVSYEVPMVTALLVPVILARSMGLHDIVEAQAQGGWFILFSPVTALIFFVCTIAELGRAPFDLAEAESEIVAGYHIEYSGMKFGMFYAGELLHALTMGALIASLFLGGWHGPFVQQVPILGVVYLFIKAFFVYWMYTWVRYTVPRIRIDHMMSLNWKFFTPLALVMVIVTAILDKLMTGLPGWIYGLGMFSANVLVAVITINLLRTYSQKERQRVAEPRPVAQADLAKAPGSGD